MTEDWLKAPAEDIDVPGAIDTSVAHQARIYDYWLGGKDNFAADREAAEQAVAAYPPILRGRWRPRDARKDEAEHEAMVQRELAAMHA